MRKLKLFSLALMALFTTQVWAADLEETNLVSSNFATATSRAYVGNVDCAITGDACPAPFTELYMAKSSSCDVAVNSATGGGSRNVSGKLQAYLNNTSKKWSWVRSSDFATTAPEVLHIKAVMLFNKSFSGAGNTMCIAVGDEFTDGMEAYPAANKVVAGFSFNGGNTNINKYAAHGTSISGTKTFTDNTEFTLDWYINNTASSISYTDPNGTSHNLAAGSFDIWIDKALFCDAVDKATNGVSGTTMQNLYIGSNGSSSKKHEFVLSSINIYSLSASVAGDYNATFVSAKGTAPETAENIASVNLVEITGIEGFKHVGWTADKVVTVDDASVAIGTQIANGKTAVLGENTTFTAVWKTAISPTLTYEATTLTKGDISSAPTLTGNTGDGAVTYSSDQPTIATVDAETGVVTAVKPGTATITASIAANGEYAAGSATCTITVEAICSISDCGNVALTYPIYVDGNTTTENLVSGQSVSGDGASALTIGAASFVGLGVSDAAKKTAAKINSCGNQPNMSGKLDMANGASYDATKYLQFAFTVKEGYTFTPCDIQFVVQPVTIKGSFHWEITDGTTVYGYGTEDADYGSIDGATVLTGLTSSAKMVAGNYYIRLYPYCDGSNTFRISNDVILRGTATSTTPTALDNTDASVKAIKSLKNGVLIIEKNGKKYNIIGSEIR